jgi:gamma-glutamyl:cysteine ligase YbdK (ATP-grasp superfamily)
MELDNHFRACKSGLGAQMIVSDSGSTAPMMQIVEQLFELSRRECENLGDSELLASLERSVSTRNGAELQRSAWQRNHSRMAVARYLADSLERPSSLRATA